MGCGSSKSQGEKKQDNSIPYEMKDCKIPEFMEIFNKGGEILKNAEELRGGIMDSKEKAIDIIQGDRLVDPNLYDAMKALFIVLAVHNGGKFPATALQVQNDPPFIIINTEGGPEEIHDLNTQIKTYLETLTAANEKIDGITTSLQELIQKAQGFPEQVGPATKNANLNALDSSKAATGLTSNLKVLTTGTQKLPILKDVITNALNDVKSVSQKIEQERSQYDEWGKQAAEKKLKLPKDVVTELWPKERFQPEKPAGQKDKSKEKEKKKETPKEKEKEKQVEAGKGLVLGYWGLKGAGEIIRYIMELTGLKYEEKLYTSPDQWFGQDKPKLNSPFPNLPYLQDGDKVITETKAIILYLVHKTNRPELLGKTPEEIVQHQQLMGVLEDIRIPLFQGDREDNYIEIATKNIKDVITPKLEILSKFLAEKQFLLGAYTTVADLALLFILQFIHKVNPEVVPSYPNLKNLVDRILALPQFVAYTKTDKFQRNFLMKV